MIKMATIRFNDENVLMVALNLDTKELFAILFDEKNGESIAYTITVEE